MEKLPIHKAYRAEAKVTKLLVIANNKVEEIEKTRIWRKRYYIAKKSGHNSIFKAGHKVEMKTLYDREGKRLTTKKSINKELEAQYSTMQP